MNCNQILCGGICHAISVTKCVLNMMTSIIIAIVHVFSIKQHLGKYYNISFSICYTFTIYSFCLFYFCLYILASFSNKQLRFQISDHTTSCTCIIFDDEAKRLLKITISDLLESLQGNIDDVPKVIQDLYGKLFIF
jgi:hypothetical protein